MLVIGCSQSELADLDEAGPKGDAEGKAERSVPGPVVRTWSRMQRAIAAIDLGSLAVFVRNGEVSVIDCRKPPLAKLDKAIPPSSKIWIANLCQTARATKRRNHNSMKSKYQVSPSMFFENPAPKAISAMSLHVHAAGLRSFTCFQARTAVQYRKPETGI